MQSHQSKRARIRAIEAKIDAEKLKGARAKETLAKLRVELKTARNAPKR